MSPTHKFHLGDIVHVPHIYTGFTREGKILMTYLHFDTTWLLVEYHVGQELRLVVAPESVCTHV